MVSRQDCWKYKEVAFAPQTGNNREYVCFGIERAGVCLERSRGMDMDALNIESLILTENLIVEYGRRLTLDEYSRATIEKYMRDIRGFYEFLPESKELSKENTIAYKKKLEQEYAATSANSMLVAVNRFLKYLGAERCCVKLFRLQREMYCRKEKEITKEEYVRLVTEARKRGDERLAMIMQTICSTGIRISELKYIDVTALKKEHARVSSKGKIRMVFLPGQLCRALLAYCKKKKIKKGSVFVTKSGNPVNRSNIWRDMKHLCESCKVSAQKVFPHNLRHLFAVTFYNMKKDVVRLADILGHASVETTRIYTATSGSDQNRILSKMNLCCFEHGKTT